MGLCDPCAEVWLKWLDYRPPQQIQLVSIGVDSARKVEEGRRLRADATHTLIRSQQKIITEICRRDHQPKET